jgi:hypothetical protein
VTLIIVSTALRHSDIWLIVSPLICEAEPCFDSAWKPSSAFHKVSKLLDSSTTGLAGTAGVICFA